MADSRNMPGTLLMPAMSGNYTCIHPDHSPGPATLDKARVKTFAASQIEDGLAAQVTEQLEKRKMLNVQPPRLLLGAFVFFSNLVVIRRHYGLPAW